MNIDALMSAAQGGDQEAAAFLQQMLAGGTSMMQRMPQIQPIVPNPPPMSEMQDYAPSYESAGQAVESLLERMLPERGGAAPQQGPMPAPAPAAGPGGPMGPMADPMAGSPAGGYDPSSQPITQTTLPPMGDDFLSMLEGAVNGGGAPGMVPETEEDLLAAMGGAGL